MLLLSQVFGFLCRFLKAEETNKPTGVIYVPIFQKIPGGSPVLGYLTAVILIGPYGLSIIHHVHGTKAIAEFEVVFLMFNIGLELSVERLSSMKKYVFGLGSAQVLVTAVVVGLVSRFIAGQPSPAAIIIGNGLHYLPLLLSFRYCRNEVRACHAMDELHFLFCFPADIISSIEFEKSGDYLAVGDRGGRIVIFERKANKDSLGEHHTHLEKLDFVDTHHPEFQYKTEFQSHEPEFDYLKSLEIEEKINKVRWCATPNGSLFILSTNDKTIKLWKVKEHKVKKVKEMDFNPFVCPENALLAERSYVSGQHKPSFGNGYFLEWTEKMANNTLPSHEGDTEVANIGDGAPARCRKVYGHAHDFNINSISNNRIWLLWFC